MNVSIFREGSIDFDWLLRLRWIAIAGQVVVVLTVDRVVGIPLPLLPLALIIGIEAASNLAGRLWARRQPRVSEPAMLGVLAFDVLLLTALLHFTGGPANPFTFLYLIHIALAAVILRGMFPWALVLLSAAAFALLFVAEPAPHGDLHGAGSYRRHLEGMWVAFVIAAGFIVHFTARVTDALAQREQELARARDLAARYDKLASLGGLAAGAAHELNTPLATIALISHELERQLARNGGGDAYEDAALIREEVKRCQDILSRMATDAGESRGEAFVPVSVSDLLDRIETHLDCPEWLQAAIVPPGSEEVIEIPVGAVVRAVANLVENARRAGEASIPVEVRIAYAGDECQIVVRDRGSGMPEETLERLGEPFFTTRPGEGMGLGVFLARSVAQRLGGSLAFRSAPGEGTEAVFCVPRRPLGERGGRT